MEYTDGAAGPQIMKQRDTAVSEHTFPPYTLFTPCPERLVACHAMASRDACGGDKLKTIPPLFFRYQGGDCAA